MIAMLGLAIAVQGAAPRPAAPQLVMPRSVQQAMTRGTRSADGRPGARYWQNRGRYVMTVTVAPPDRLVRGQQEITYVNDSPDTLAQLGFKLFMNIHAPGAPRAFAAPPEYLGGGITVSRFTVAGQTVPWAPGGPFTNRLVRLPRPLLPRDSVRLTVDWEYPISLQANREGMLDSTTFFLAYFYPRVSVYDDIDGWDLMDFTDVQEFYSDFNDYDVTIRVPDRFVVWGTGTLRTAADVLQPDALRRYRAALTSDTTIRIASLADMRSGTVTRRGGMNAWRFTATNVPDVAFGLSDHYVWDGGSVVVDPARPRVTVEAAYNDTAPDFRHMVRFASGSLAWISAAANWPGVPYPYEKTVVFQGGAGMEYPMVVNDDAYADTAFAKFVAAHEILHTYFPFMTGINESRYAFMDEGWTTAFELLLNRVDMGVQRAENLYRQIRINGWARNPSALGTVPIIAPADGLKGGAYGDNAYGKPALGFLALKDLLGDDAFRRGLHAFIERWQGKHPTPWDMFNTFNDATGTNLDWFWRDWFYSGGYMDYGLVSVTPGRRGFQLVLENRGGLPAPVDVEVRYQDGSAETLHQTPRIWANGPRATISRTTNKRLAAIQLTSSVFVDADTTNNHWRAP